MRLQGVAEFLETLRFELSADGAGPTPCQIDARCLVERHGIPALLLPGERVGALDHLATRSRAVIRARAAAGLTQAEFAERMGTSQSYIARLESGCTLPSTRTLLKVAEATGTRPRFDLEAA